MMAMKITNSEGTRRITTCSDQPLLFYVAHLALPLEKCSSILNFLSLSNEKQRAVSTTSTVGTYVGTRNDKNQCGTWDAFHCFPMHHFAYALAPVGGIWLSTALSIPTPPKLATLTESSQSMLLVLDGHQESIRIYTYICSNAMPIMIRWTPIHILTNTILIIKICIVNLVCKQLAISLNLYICVANRASPHFLLIKSKITNSGLALSSTEFNHIQPSCSFRSLILGQGPSSRNWSLDVLGISCLAFLCFKMQHRMAVSWLTQSPGAVEFPEGLDLQPVAHYSEKLRGSKISSARKNRQAMQHKPLESIGIHWTISLVINDPPSTAYLGAR